MNIWECEVNIFGGWDICDFITILNVNECKWLVTNKMLYLSNISDHNVGILVNIETLMWIMAINMVMSHDMGGSLMLEVSSLNIMI
jgi:hypothetical protein